MHLSIQFRHKATSTMSGEITTVSDCAEATHCLQQNDMFKSISWAEILSEDLVSSILMQVLTSSFDHKIAFGFLASSVFSCQVCVFI